MSSRLQERMDEERAGMVRVNAKSRTRQMHETLKRRAQGAEVCALDAFRQFFNDTLRTFPFCPYCNVTLDERNVSLDHFTPASRGGTHHTSNLGFVCKSCNKAKGNMTFDEFKGLLSALDEWSIKHRNPKLRDDVLTALKVAQSFRQGANRRAKR